MSNYRKVSKESVNVTSTNRGFRKIQQSVATYEQTERIVLFLSQKIVEKDGVHTKSVHL